VLAFYGSPPGPDAARVVTLEPEQAAEPVEAQRRQAGA
jgi:hypothetical protein